MFVRSYRATTMRDAPVAPSSPTQTGSAAPSSTRRSAVLTLCVVVLALAGGLSYPATTPPARPAQTPASTTDALTFAAVVERMRKGEGYYDAMGAELRQNGYPARDPFNWRTPLHLSALALAPWAVWRGLLTALLVSLYAAAMSVVLDRLTRWSVGGLLLGVLVVLAATDAIFVSEVWAGTLIGLSACAFAIGRRRVAFGFAMGALFVRELAAPYCVLCALSAARTSRWREFGAWAAGAAFYAAYYAVHVVQVTAHRLPTDVSHGGSWFTLPGLPFLQATLLMVGWFGLLPIWSSSIALALVAAGLTSPATPRHIRAASSVYAALFLFAGFPFNDYWGYVAAPAWAITGGYGVAALIEASVSVGRLAAAR